MGNDSWYAIPHDRRLIQRRRKLDRLKRVAATDEKRDGVERCEICAPFLPPDQCRTVVGPVSRQGWCKIYTGA